MSGFPDSGHSTSWKLRDLTGCFRPGADDNFERALENRIERIRIEGKSGDILDRIVPLDTGCAVKRARKVLTHV